MADRRIGVALGAGAARGWAHIGVLRGLLERGLAPGVVAGSSMGALVGAAYASQKLDAFESWARGLDRRTVLGFFDLSLRGGLIEARRILSFLQSEMPDVDIAELPIRYGAVATELERGREVWLNEGSLHQALRASYAMPGLISPSYIDGRWVLDGGLVNPVPVSLCRALGAEVVVAVDLNTTLAAPTPESPPLSSVDRSLDELAEEASARLSSADEPSAPEPEPEPPPPSIFDVLSRSAGIMQLRITRSRMAGDPPDLHVIPHFEGFSWLEFDRAAVAIDEGRAALDRALASVPWDVFASLRG